MKKLRGGQLQNKDCRIATQQLNPEFYTLRPTRILVVSLCGPRSPLDNPCMALHAEPQAEAYNNLGWLFWDHGDLAQATGARESMFAGLAV